MTAAEESFLRYVATIPRAELDVRYTELLTDFTKLHNKYVRLLEETVDQKVEEK